MSRSLPVRAYQTAVHALARRDQMEMRAMNALLAKIEPASRVRATARKAPTERDTVGGKQTMARHSARSTLAGGFRAVLCPVDFSEASRLALRCAAAVARRGKASLTVFYANDPLLIAAAAAALHDRTLVRRSQVELEQFVADTLPVRGRKGLVVTTMVSTGRPATEIMSVAARSRADLIVVGTHGLTGADRMLLGSTTLSILRQSAVPVLAVPRATSGQPTPLGPDWPGKWLAAAVELDGSSKRGASNAARVARWFGASLCLVHVVPAIATPPWLEQDLETHNQARVADARAQLERLEASLRPRLNTKVRVLLGHAADEIAAFAAAERIGLVITTLRESRGWFGPRRGSISYHLLSHATTPVLALPARRARP